LRKVYSKSDLERRCKGDKTKLDRLQGMMSGEGDLLREVAPPPSKPQSGGGKRKQDELTPPDRPLEEKEREKLKRRAISRRICLGQLVWDCSQRPPRAAKVTAIAAERQEPFLIRHLDAPKGPSRSSFKVGDEVMVHDRVGICIWDGRPEHQYARVRWDDDGSESEILPVSQITAENRCLEEVFVSDADLAPLDLSHLLHAASKKESEDAEVAEDAQVVDPLELCPVAIPPPRELMVRSSETREKLAVGQVAWCHQKCRLPWPAQLLSFTEGQDARPSSRIWTVKYLECETEETVSATRLSAFLPGDATALAEVAQVAEREFRTSSASLAAAAAKAAAAEAVKQMAKVKEESDVDTNPLGAVSA